MAVLAKTTLLFSKARNKKKSGEFVLITFSAHQMAAFTLKSYQDGFDFILKFTIMMFNKSFFSTNMTPIMAAVTEQ